MKTKLLAATIMTAIVASLGGWVYAGQSDDMRTVKGTIVDLQSYMHSGYHGRDIRERSIDCVKVGGPVAIVDLKGRVYVLLSEDAYTPSALVDRVVDRIDDSATVTGRVEDRGGVRALVVDSVRN